MAKNPRSAVTAGTQRRRAKPHKREDESTEDDKLETELDNGKKESNGTTDNGDETVARKRQKRAAACSNFKEKALDLPEKDSVVTIKENQIEEEIEAVRLTKTGPEDQRPCRKLIDFILHDGDGNLQPFEMSEVYGIFITALVTPLNDDLEKDRGRGIRCIGFGRIEGWAISGYDEGAAVIWVSTELADYKCVKPASSYRSYFDHFSEKARVCVEVYTKLARSVGGNPQLDLEGLLASVFRTINSNRSFSGTVSKDFVISIGEFIHNQLVGLDHTASNDDEILATLSVLAALRDECKSRVEFSKLPLASYDIKENSEDKGWAV